MFYRQSGPGGVQGCHVCRPCSGVSLAALADRGKQVECFEVFFFSFFPFDGNVYRWQDLSEDEKNVYRNKAKEEAVALRDGVSDEEADYYLKQVLQEFQRTVCFL